MLQWLQRFLSGEGNRDPYMDTLKEIQSASPSAPSDTAPDAAGSSSAVDAVDAVDNESKKAD